MLYKNFTCLSFPKMCIFPNTRIYSDGGNQQFMINFFGLVHSDPINKTEVGENMQLFVIFITGQKFGLLTKDINMMISINLRC